MNQSIEKNDPLVDKAFARLRDDSEPSPPSALDDLAERRMTESILNRYDDQRRASSNRNRNRIRSAIAVAAVIFAAAGVALILANRSGNSSASVAHTPATSKTVAIAESPGIPGSRFELLLGEVMLADGVATNGTEIPTNQLIRTGEGQAAISLPTGIAVGMSQRTSLKVSANGHRDYRVKLESGMALFSIDPTRIRDGFHVDTSAGTLRVTGTLFTVAVGENGGVYVMLHRGNLELTRSNGRTSEIPQRKIVRVDSQGDIDPSYELAMTGQLRAMSCIDRGAIFTEIEKTICTADTRSGLSTREKPAPAESTARVLPIKDLMATARSEKTRGNWRDAAQAYQQIIRHYPTSDEARTSMVSLGQIQLSHLGEARAALSHFNRYLKKAGPLSQEAMYGKASAHRALGDTQSEKQALLNLRSAFPAGIHTAAINKRLAELEGH